MPSFFASCALALEPFLKQELLACGVQAPQVRVQKAGVAFEASWEVAYRVCLWSRVASRVFYPLHTFSLRSRQELYPAVQQVPWSDHLGVEQTFLVEAVGDSQAVLTHFHDAALQVKNAIVDQFRERCGARPSIDKEKPDLRFHLAVQGAQATLSLDLSGGSLHQRGYRAQGGKAPLKENLAAALLMATGWPEGFSHLVDPMMGSATFVIEAAWMAARIPPACLRTRFGFSRWRGHQPALWKHLQEESRDLEIRQPKQWPEIRGYDDQAAQVTAALAHRETAGLRQMIHVERRDFFENRPTYSSGLLVMNPPYGERLSLKLSEPEFYQAIGNHLKQAWKGWEAWILCSHPEAVSALHLQPSRRLVCYQGALECRFLKYPLF